MATTARSTSSTETIVTKTPDKNTTDNNYDAEGQRRRTNRYLGHQEDRGLVQCKVWIPANRRDDLVKYASNLREQISKSSNS